MSWSQPTPSRLVPIASPTFEISLGLPPDDHPVQHSPLDGSLRLTDSGRFNPNNPFNPFQCHSQPPQAKNIQSPYHAKNKWDRFLDSVMQESVDQDSEVLDEHIFPCPVCGFLLAHRDVQGKPLTRTSSPSHPLLLQLPRQLFYVPCIQDVSQPSTDSLFYAPPSAPYLHKTYSRTFPAHPSSVFLAQPYAPTSTMMNHPHSPSRWSSIHVAPNSPSHSAPHLYTTSAPCARGSQNPFISDFSEQTPFRDYYHCPIHVPVYTATPHISILRSG